MTLTSLSVPASFLNDTFHSFMTNPFIYSITAFLDILSDKKCACTYAHMYIDTIIYVHMFVYGLPMYVYTFVANVWILGQWDGSVSKGWADEPDDLRLILGKLSADPQKFTSVWAHIYTHTQIYVCVWIYMTFTDTLTYFRLKTIKKDLRNAKMALITVLVPRLIFNIILKPNPKNTLVSAEHGW